MLLIEAQRHYAMFSVLHAIMVNMHAKQQASGCLKQRTDERQRPVLRELGRYAVFPTHHPPEARRAGVIGLERASQSS